MENMKSDQAIDKIQMDRALDALGGDIARLTEAADRVVTEIPGLILFRKENITPPTVGMYEPSICVMAQGAKRIQLGDDTFVYNSQHYLITSIDLPTFVQVIDASREKPCLGFMLKLDQSEISQLMIDQRLPAPRPQQSSRGMAIGDVTLPLITAFQRLLALLREPNDIPVLAPMIQREIYYRLLVGDQGLRLRQMAAIESQNRQIARAIEWIKINFSHSIKIEELASQVGMSPSTFHHHFRMITAMSPLQYQKKQRLNEARRLMLSKRLDATTAAVQVGYESPSQFSREYRRLFGNSPLRDIRNLREMSTPQFVT